MIEVFEIGRGQRDHSTSGGSLGYCQGSTGLGGLGGDGQICMEY